MSTPTLGDLFRPTVFRIVFTSKEKPIFTLSNNEMIKMRFILCVDDTLFSGFQTKIIKSVIIATKCLSVCEICVTLFKRFSQQTCLENNIGNTHFIQCHFLQGARDFSNKILLPHRTHSCCCCPDHAASIVAT